MIRKAAKSNVMFNKIIFNLTIQQADFFSLLYLAMCGYGLKMILFWLCQVSWHFVKQSYKNFKK